MHGLHVPGGDINAVDNLEGTRTLLRCEVARDLLYKKRNAYDFLIVSGAQCHDPSIETQPIAKTMADWFATQDVRVPIIQVTESRDTYEDVRYTMTALKKKYSGPYEITVVSQWQHTLRLAITYKRLYGIRIHRVALHYPMSVREFAKEWAYIGYHLYDKEGKYYLARLNREHRTRAPSGDATALPPL